MDNQVDFVRRAVAEVVAEYARKGKIKNEDQVTDLIVHVFNTLREKGEQEYEHSARFAFIKRLLEEFNLNEEAHEDMD